MNRLLYHVCNHKVDVLNPNDYEEGAICLSEGAFVGALGQWLYVFDYDVLHEHFDIYKMHSDGMQVFVAIPHVEYRFKGQPLGVEYRIRLPIDVHKFALGVAQNFEVCKGVLEKRIEDKMFQEIME